MDSPDILFVTLVISTLVSIIVVTVVHALSSHRPEHQPPVIEDDTTPQRPWIVSRKQADCKAFLRRLLFHDFPHPCNCNECSPALYFNYLYSCIYHHSKDDIVNAPGQTATLTPQFDLPPYEASMLVRRTIESFTRPDAEMSPEQLETMRGLKSCIRRWDLTFGLGLVQADQLVDSAMLHMLGIHINVLFFFGAIQNLTIQRPQPSWTAFARCWAGRKREKAGRETSAFPPFDYEGAALKGTRENASLSALPDLPLKFQSFYPQLRHVLLDISRGPCLVSLQAYEGNLTARREACLKLMKYGGVSKYCYLQNECILSTLDESSKSNMASASVLLGLTPTILASLGPTIAEISLLFSRRPLLSLLLSMGAPVTYFTRFLQFDNPFDLLHRPGRPSFLRMARKLFRFGIALSFFQYIFAILAIINLVATSVELGHKTVVSWRCSVSWIPLMWAITPIACYAPAILSFELYRRKAEALWFPDKTKESRLSCAVRCEFVISANNTDTMFTAEMTGQVHPGAWSVVLQSTSSLFVILQIVFGTAVFSSLLYLGVEDATLLLLRYATSAFLCRLVMYLELEGMILVAQDQERRCYND
ncbi:hypothetical protein CC86DRAFT_411912 [Ophiobolus disseminans]|uniref:Uncharacterized protein n=1 Tax=Ophiobolus disseminans TaxID=1469910 RepID=A0A6A6ZI15_9PLEO|nr:hypothetical protein CC86DRAFT_411912 [Ophiobolus disseminans]